MKDHVIFHCAELITDIDGNVIRKNKKVLKKTATHTLVFNRYSDDIIIMGWAATHPNDNYNKKTGVSIANSQATMINVRLNDFPNRKIFDIDSLYGKVPTSISADSFDYYLDCAVSLMYDVNTVNDLKLVFRATDNTINSIKIEFDDISLDELKIVAEERHMRSQNIFALIDDTFVIQQRKSFYDDGFNKEYNDKCVASLAQQLTDLTDKELLSSLSDLGYCYDPNLELEFVKEN